MNYIVEKCFDERFNVIDVCNESGGMGQVLFVQDNHGEFSGDLVLKYCRDDDEEYIKRFKREVRLLELFKDNSKVVDVLYSNVYHEPPFFVMKHYPKGDLLNIIDELKDNPIKQEIIFNQMIDCIAEMHSQDIFHRDIKPQNFLFDGDALVVSDFGLGYEPTSTSRFTTTSMFWGTHGYLPPEFRDGGFKHADAAGDIFMLGKSFYVLLTGQDPTYIMNSPSIHNALLHVIKRACETEKRNRYRNLSELKQALSLAFDVVTNRQGIYGEVTQLFSAINDFLDHEELFDPNQVNEFLKKLNLLVDDDKKSFCKDLRKPFFLIISQAELIDQLPSFLETYMDFIESQDYSWAFAEIIAANMKIIFSNKDISDEIRASALKGAIFSAYSMNRFAAMDTCSSMILSVDNDNLGLQIVPILQEFEDSFIANIEPRRCHCDIVRQTLEAIRKRIK